MKLAIYGDSFADSEGSWHKGSSWINCLQAQGIAVSNHSESGAGQLWIWDQFVRHHQDHDRVIVIQTYPGRLWLPHAPGGKQHFTGVNDCQNFRQRQGRSVADTAQAIENYYRYIQHDRVDMAITDVVLAHTLQTRPDCLIMPALRLPQAPRLNDRDGRVHLEDIYAVNLARAHELLPLATANELEWGNRLICHMSRENNQQLAKDVIKWMETGLFHLDLADYPAFDSSDIDYYFPRGK